MGAKDESWTVLAGDPNYKTNPGPEEEVEIPLGEIMPGDHELVKPGAVFY
jgi:hypothetical protein